MWGPWAAGLSQSALTAVRTASLSMLGAAVSVGIPQQGWAEQEEGSVLKRAEIFLGGLWQEWPVCSG